MKRLLANPLLSPWAIIVVALSLSIGWGIRGNYGHETGAMLPGALAALAVCLLSGREDWQRRAVYFAFFGALGWAFGGSISYMQVIGYTHSGQEESQLYGFYGLFAIGFLWAALGGAGTSLPAFLGTKRLGDLVSSFVPLFVVWCGLYVLEDTPIPEMVKQKVEQFVSPKDASAADAVEKTTAARAAGAERPKMERHEHPLYWLDSDWIPASVMLATICLVDLFRRRFRRADVLVLLGGLGATAGFGAQFGLVRAGYADLVYDHLVRVQGDPTRFPPYLLISNWPQILLDHTEFAGVLAGLILGFALYFALFGEFGRGLRLYLYLAVGWLVGFLGLAVLGGIHMTPPRGDDWAGVAGMTLFAWLYFLRARWHSALLASIVCGAIGGVGFSAAAWLKLWLLSNGNPAIVSDPAILDAWRHFQRANWHSFLEQTYGFINGIGVAVAMALLVARAPVVRSDPESPPRRRPEVFALFFVLPVLLYVNMVKNVNDWTADAGGRQALPSVMKAPLLGSIELNAWTWFTLLFWFVAAAFTLAAILHRRRPLPLLPESRLGRGEWLYLVLLWSFVLGNWAKALVHFNEQRLLTEGVVTLNAALATVLLLWTATTRETVRILENPRFGLWIPASLVVAGLLAYFVPIGQTRHVRHIYGDAFAGHSGRAGQPVLRFGPEAAWRIDPNLRGSPHR